MRRRQSQSPRFAVKSEPRLIQRLGRLEVWLMQGDMATKRIGSVGIPLAADALRHGEDLVAALLDQARRELERRQPVPPAAG